jgi:outer membrane protein TolC
MSDKYYVTPNNAANQPNYPIFPRAIRPAGVLSLGLGLLLAVSPMVGPGRAGTLLAADTAPAPRIYSFAEVTAIAQNNGGEIIRQKASADQAAQNKDSQLSNYQSQVYNFYSDPNSGIAESSLYSLQESYESAYNAYLDAEEGLEKLKPKVAWQAQKLYLDILQGERQIEIQVKEVERLRAEYDLAQAKQVFGGLTQSQLNAARGQWEAGLETLDNLRVSQENNRDTMREYLNIAAGVDFGLENPPNFGQYAKTFDPETVMTAAWKNSLSLKQAQREVDELSERIILYISRGQPSQADRLAANGASVDLALKETKKTLTTAVENTLRDYAGLDAALEKAAADHNQAISDHLAIQMKQRLGTASLNDLLTAEKNRMTAAKNYIQAQYNCYLGARRVILLQEGVLVSGA